MTPSAHPLAPAPAAVPVLRPTVAHDAASAPAAAAPIPMNASADANSGSAGMAAQPLLEPSAVPTMAVAAVAPPAESVAQGSAARNDVKVSAVSGVAATVAVASIPKSIPANLLTDEKDPKRRVSARRQWHSQNSPLLNLPEDAQRCINSFVAFPDLYRIAVDTQFAIVVNFSLLQRSRDVFFFDAITSGSVVSLSELQREFKAEFSEAMVTGVRDSLSGTTEYQAKRSPVDKNLMVQNRLVRNFLKNKKYFLPSIRHLYRFYGGGVNQAGKEKPVLKWIQQDEPHDFRFIAVHLAQALNDLPVLRELIFLGSDDKKEENASAAIVKRKQRNKEMTMFLADLLSSPANTINILPWLCAHPEISEAAKIAFCRIMLTEHNCKRFTAEAYAADDVDLAIHKAARLGQLELVGLLAEKNPATLNVNGKLFKKDTPIEICLKNRKISAEARFNLAIKLFALGAKLNEKSDIDALVEYVKITKDHDLQAYIFKLFSHDGDMKAAAPPCGRPADQLVASSSKKVSIRDLVETDNGEALVHGLTHSKQYSIDLDDLRPALQKFDINVYSAINQYLKNRLSIDSGVPTDEKNPEVTVQIHDTNLNAFIDEMGRKLDQIVEQLGLLEKVLQDNQSEWQTPFGSIVEGGMSSRAYRIFNTVIWMATIALAIAAWAIKNGDFTLFTIIATVGWKVLDWGISAIVRFGDCRGVDNYRDHNYEIGPRGITRYFTLIELPTEQQGRLRHFTTFFKPVEQIDSKTNYLNTEVRTVSPAVAQWREQISALRVEFIGITGYRSLLMSAVVPQRRGSVVFTPAGPQDQHQPLLLHQS